MTLNDKQIAAVKELSQAAKNAYSLIVGGAYSMTADRLLRAIAEVDGMFKETKPGK